MSKIIETSSKSLLEYSNMTSNFIESINYTLNNINSSIGLLPTYWKGDQADKFMEYLEQFNFVMKKQLNELTSMSEKIHKKAMLLKDIESQ